MPHKDGVTSDSESERQHTGSAHKKYSAKKARRESSDVADMSDVEELKSAGDPSEGAAQEEEGEEEGEGEEYEIEAILDAKKGQFAGGKMGYFVKWKNYGEEHNSWVDEEDAGNAQELIDDFWNKRRKNKAAGRKSEPLKSRPKSVTAKPSRKSLAQESSPEVVEAPSPTKKRGRPRKSGVDSDVEIDAAGDEPRVKKKTRKSDGATLKADKPDSDDEVGNMNVHLHIPSWEHLIESVDTVERDSDGELIVYFTLKNGKGRKRENSRICAERFPQKLIKFYESNLRWRVEEGEAEN
ncbi:hypothetical protein SCLCIDRAFT_1217487 [Scleroderma citrinum Foug A]|uniref:Chromo domain-containing protein n=1 Tax=Scleroderma citrinum Foug A TaxID=1036808 RepID=A0A0C3DUU7_9AGAM|nr:hypothetical protein SCLCIDRAFT_1217487 [Scleroderma citrinum Foug A]